MFYRGLWIILFWIFDSEFGVWKSLLAYLDLCNKNLGSSQVLGSKSEIKDNKTSLVFGFITLTLKYH